MHKITAKAWRNSKRQVMYLLSCINFLLSFGSILTNSVKTFQSLVFTN